MDKSVFINHKGFIFPFFFLLMGVIIVIFSPEVSNNIFDNFNYLLTNQWFIIMTFLALCSMFNEVLDICKKENLILRSESLSSYIKSNVKKSVKISVVYIILAILFGMFSLVFLHVKDFSNKGLDGYGISSAVYSLFLFIRFIILLSLSSVIYFFIGWNYKKSIAIIYCTLFIGLLLSNIDIVPLENIGNIFPIPILVTSYFHDLIFSNFSLELSASIIQVVILVIICMIIFEKYFVRNQEKKIK